MRERAARVHFDLTLAGPFATFLLAGLGARVIKIENPESPDPCRQNPPYLGRNGVSLGRTDSDDVSVSAISHHPGVERSDDDVGTPRPAWTR